MEGSMLWRVVSSSMILSSFSLRRYDIKPYSLDFVGFCVSFFNLVSHEFKSGCNNQQIWLLELVSYGTELSWHLFTRLLPAGWLGSSSLARETQAKRLNSIYFQSFPSKSVRFATATDPVWCVERRSRKTDSYWQQENKGELKIRRLFILFVPFFVFLTLILTPRCRFPTKPLLFKRERSLWE